MTTTPLTDDEIKGYQFAARTVRNVDFAMGGDTALRLLDEVVKRRAEADVLCDNWCTEEMEHVHWQERAEAAEAKLAAIREEIRPTRQALDYGDLLRRLWLILDGEA